MAYLPDLSLSNYFQLPAGMNLRSVGWLSYEHAFSIGPVQASVIAQFERLLETPFTPWQYLGFHRCDLCSATRRDALSDAVQPAVFPDPRIALPPPIARYNSEGTRNLLVPGDHEIYACPELILHYIGDHGYSPPEEFCRALLRCPPIPSIRYFHRLIQAGGEVWATFIETLLDPPSFMTDRLKQLGRQHVQARPDRTMRIALRAARLWRAPWYRWFRHRS